VASAVEERYKNVDVRISYLFPDWDPRITAFGKNLIDTVHGSNKLPTDMGAWTTFAPPCIYGVRIGMDF
jgi:hypothetical protein